MRDKKGRYSTQMNDDQWKEIKNMIRDKKDVNEILSKLVLWGYSTVHGYRLMEKAAKEIGAEK